MKRKDAGMQSHSSRSKASLSAGSRNVVPHERRTGVNPSRVWWVFCGLALVLLGIAFLSLDGYSVETTVQLKLDNFLSQAERTALLARELDILQSEELRHAVARSLGRPAAGYWTSGIEHVLAWPERPATFGDQLGSEWCAPPVSIVPVVSSAGASVTLAVSGGDPDELKKTLTEYVKRYVDHKRTPGPTAGTGCTVESAEKTPFVSSDAIREITGRIDKLRMTENQCELALGMLDATNGTFRGFMPAGELAGMPALKQFQDRIVELAIKVRERQVNFTPKSREILDLQLQIKGVRDSMKDYVTTQLQFLKRNRENLMAQKAELLHRQCSQGKPLSPASWRSPETRDVNTFSVTRGLQVRVDEPTISRRPLLLSGLERIKSALDSALSI